MATTTYSTNSTNCDDNQSGYKAHAVPILQAGVKVGVVEAGIAALDIANVQIVIDTK